MGPDHPVPPADQPSINVRFINLDYLPTMHIPLVSGRNIVAADRANPYIALISERTAREAFPREDPVGKKIDPLVPDDKHPRDRRRSCGGHAHQRPQGHGCHGLRSLLAFTPWTLSFLVRSSQPSDALIPEMRRAICQIDPQIAIPALKSMDKQVSDSVATDRFKAMVLSGFGVAALLLALLGGYGVLAYSVSLRRREFGIRIALGSGKSALIGLVMRQAARPVLVGTGGGLMIALRWVRSLFYQTPLTDPFAVGGSVLLLLVAAGIAAIVPARRAASTDPMRALRTE
jgi:putative ABC transport system permease protein